MALALFDSVSGTKIMKGFPILHRTNDFELPLNGETHE
jgi:hypothetical protein